MTTVEFLDLLRAQDVRLRRKGDRLLCNAPEGVLTPELLDEIGRRKSEILANLGIGDQRALSFAQERFWFLHQLNSDSAAYNIPFSCRIRGRLDLDALGRSVAESVRRHEVLRTSYPAIDGIPSARVAPSSSWHWTSHDISSLPEAVRKERVRQHLDEEERRPFDLVRGPVLRMELLRIGADEHVILLTAAHIAFDLWSWSILFAEIAASYPALLRGESGVFDPLPLQFTEYARRQRETVATRDGDQLDYWRTALSKPDSWAEVPPDFARPAMRTTAGADALRRLPEGVTHAVRHLLRSESVTPFVLFLAAWSALLARWSGHPMARVGVPVAHRPSPELEKLIGPFLNTVVISTDTTGDPSFRALLLRVRATVLDALDHQDVPFERVVEVLAQQRDLARDPLFQVAFAFQPQALRSLVLPGLEIEELAHTTRTAKFDLALFVTDTEDGFSARLEFATGLFARATVERLLDDYLDTLAAVVDRPDDRLSALLPAAPKGRPVATRAITSTLTGSPSISPRTETERALAEIWSELLKHTPIHIEDDFFELGGHSLLATQVVARVARRLGVTLPLRALFELPTVAGLATLIDAAARYERPPPGAMDDFEDGAIR